MFESICCCRRGCQPSTLRLTSFQASNSADPFRLYLCLTGLTKGIHNHKHSCNHTDLRQSSEPMSVPCTQCSDANVATRGYIRIHLLTVPGTIPSMQTLTKLQYLYLGIAGFGRETKSTMEIRSDVTLMETGFSGEWELHFCPYVNTSLCGSLFGLQLRWMGSGYIPSSIGFLKQLIYL